MKKLAITTASIIILATAIMAAVIFLGSKPQPQMTAPDPTPVAIKYTAYGRYYTDGTLVTADGHIWSYVTDMISGETPYDGIPVWAAFSDGGTPDNITDDTVLGLVYDRETAIYDALEEALSAEFETERDGNNITVKIKEG